MKALPIIAAATVSFIGGVFAAPYIQEAVQPEPTPYVLDVKADCGDFQLSFDDREMIATGEEIKGAHVATVLHWYTADRALWVEIDDEGVKRLMKVTHRYIGEQKETRLKHTRECTVNGLPNLDGAL
ncbi:hypothetical protein [Vibrio sp. WXL210]|uniref:hypothetical protein n=1 Tax=Vibrio sp. WXL210 TaxID=3450709 RepID=UPI003EC61DDD